jgi:hypothetical protein
VDVQWTATDPDPGQLCCIPRRSPAGDYVARIEALLVLGQGYSALAAAERRAKKRAERN